MAFTASFSVPSSGWLPIRRSRFSPSTTVLAGLVCCYLDEVDEAAKLCGAINTVVNLRDENGQVTGKLKGYNTDGMGYWQALTEEGIDFKGMKMVLIGTGGAATAIAVRGALDGVAEIEIFNIKDKFYSRGEEIVDLINKNTNCKATMNDLADKDLLKEKMHAADLFCDATGVGMHPLEDLSNIPDPSFFKKDLIVTDTVYAPRETVMMKQAKEARENGQQVLVVRMNKNKKFQKEQLSKEGYEEFEEFFNK